MKIKKEKLPTYGEAISIKDGEEVKVPILGRSGSQMVNCKHGITKRTCEVVAFNNIEGTPVVAIQILSEKEDGNDVNHQMVLTHESAFQVMVTLMASMDALGVNETYFDKINIKMEQSPTFPEYDHAEDKKA